MMIKMHISSPNPVGRLRQGRFVALFGTLSVMLAILSLPARAEDVADANAPEAGAAPSATKAGIDWSAMSQQEIQEAMVVARTEFVQIRQSLQECRGRVEESEPGKELLQEMVALRKELALVEVPVEQPAGQTEDQAREQTSRALQLRRQLHAKEAERLALLDQSEEYRKLSARENEVKEQLRVILEALQDESTQEIHEQMK